MIRVFGGRASALLIAFFRCLPNARNRVILPINICEVVRASVMTAGCEPIFCDIDEGTLCINLSQAEEVLQKNKAIGALLFCHTYGTAFWPNTQLAHLKARYGVAIIDDRAAMFPECGDIDTFHGTSADLVLYSTGYAKCVALPEGGGMGYLAEPFAQSFNIGTSIADPRMEKAMKASPKSADWFQHHPWYTSACPFEGKTYLERIQSLREKSQKHKAQLNAIYDLWLTHWKMPQDIHTWRYTLRLPPPQRELALKRIFDAGLFASAHYKPLVAGSYPIAQRLSEEVLNLFNDGYFTEEQAERCAQTILEAIQ